MGRTGKRYGGLPVTLNFQLNNLKVLSPLKGTILLHCAMLNVLFDQIIPSDSASILMS